MCLNAFAARWFDRLTMTTRFIDYLHSAIGNPHSDFGIQHNSFLLRFEQSPELTDQT